MDDFGFDFGPTADGAAYLGLSYANGPGPEGRINATAADSSKYGGFNGHNNADSS